MLFYFDEFIPVVEGDYKIFKETLLTQDAACTNVLGSGESHFGVHLIFADEKFDLVEIEGGPSSPDSCEIGLRSLCYINAQHLSNTFWKQTSIGS